MSTLRRTSATPAFWSVHRAIGVLRIAVAGLGARHSRVYRRRLRQKLSKSVVIDRLGEVGIKSGRVGARAVCFLTPPGKGDQ